MAINYDSFLGFETPRHNTQYYVDVKIEYLYHLCILHTRYNGRVADPLEDAVRQMLMACKTESAMTSCLHDVIFNDKPITKLLEQKGVLH